MAWYTDCMTKKQVHMIALNTDFQTGRRPTVSDVRWAEMLRISSEIAGADTGVSVSYSVHARVPRGVGEVIVVLMPPYTAEALEAVRKSAKAQRVPLTILTL